MDWEKTWRTKKKTSQTTNRRGRDWGNEKEREPDDEKKGSGSKAMAGDDSGSLAEVSSCAGGEQVALARAESSTDENLPPPSKSCGRT